MTEQPRALANSMLEPPYSQEAEAAVLGAVLVNPEILLSIAAFIKADDFYILRHKTIWEAYMRLNGRDEAIDVLTLAEELHNMGWLNDIGESYITELVNATPTSLHAEFYARIVERAAIRRRLMKAADEIKALALNEEMDIDRVITDAEMRMFNVTDRQLKREFVHLQDAVEDYWNQIEHMMANPEISLGVPSGFKDLDELLGGFQRSDLVIFAGRPGMGKCLSVNNEIITSNGIYPIADLKPSGVHGMADDEGGIYYPLHIPIHTPAGLRQTAYFYESGLRPTLTVTTRNGLIITGTHPHPVMVMTANGLPQWTPLALLKRGDRIAVQPNTVKWDNQWDTVTAIENSGLQPCYDLTVPDGHSFVANGIVNHNTSFLLSTAVNAARLGARIAIFTMEMGADQLVQRMISMETGINMQKLRLGRLDPHEYSRFVEAAGRISRFPIFIDDTPALNPIQMRTKCRRLQHEHGIDMIILDYLQLMNSGGSYENNRVQEVSYISRALKELAREINAPIISAAQLSRSVEQRQDKRPLLSDLRESGCLAGESPVFLPDEGHTVPIRDLVGKTGFRVLSLNTETWKLEPGVVTNAFATGVKPVYKLTTRLGRTIRATGNHKFLTICGWKRLDELTTEDHIALPRTLPTLTEQTMSDSELALLGHMLGDGCTLPTHALQYTTRETDLAELVVQLATDVFGDKLRPRIHKEPDKGWYQVFLPPTQQLTHNVYNPMRVWLSALGVWGLRSYEKFVPEKVFQQPKEAIARFLRHLWATDGSVSMKKTTKGTYPHIYYASSSRRLASDVQSLLLRLEINATLKIVPQIGKGRDQYHVILGGGEDLTRFADLVGAAGAYRQGRLESVREYLATHPTNTNRDVIPHNIWRMYATPSMQQKGITTRQMHAGLGMAYAGTTVYKQNVSRDRAARLAQVVNSAEIALLAQSDVYWDSVVSIEPDGTEEVFDLTVDKYHNFSSGNIILHNSIEQDSDVVLFLYRDSVYNEATEFPNQADVIVSKHRNGPTGTVSMYFDRTLTKFMDAAVRRVDLGDV